MPTFTKISSSQIVGPSLTQRCEEIPLNRGGHWFILPEDYLRNSSMATVIIRDWLLLQTARLTSSTNHWAGLEWDGRKHNTAQEWPRPFPSFLLNALVQFKGFPTNNKVFIFYLGPAQCGDVSDFSERGLALRCWADSTRAQRGQKIHLGLLVS